MKRRFWEKRLQSIADINRVSSCLRVRRTTEGGVANNLSKTLFTVACMLAFFAFVALDTSLSIAQEVVREDEKLKQVESAGIKNITTEHSDCLYINGVCYVPATNPVVYSSKGLKGSADSKVNQNTQASFVPASKDSAYLRIGLGYNYGKIKGGMLSAGESMGIADIGIGWNHYAKNNFFYALGVGVGIVFGEKFMYDIYSTQKIGMGVLIDIKNKLGYYWDSGSIREYVYGLIGPVGFFDVSILSPWIRSFMGGGIMFGIGYGISSRQQRLGFFIEFAVPIMFSNESFSIDYPAGYNLTGYSILYQVDLVTFMPRVVAGLQIGF